MRFHRVGRERDDRNAGTVAFADTDQPRRRESVHVGHLEIHQHGVEGLVRGRLDCRTAVRDGDTRMPQRIEDAARETTVHRIVVGEQQVQAPRRLRDGTPGPAAGRVGAHLGHDVARHRERECAASAGRAADGDVAAHEPREAHRDAESEPGAAEAARDRLVGLVERFEDRLRTIGRDVDPDAGVDDRELQFRATARGRRAESHAHRAAFRELQCIADEVHEHLAHAPRIARDPRRHGVRVHVALELETLRSRAMLEGQDAFAHQPLRIERGRLEVHPAGLDLREVEDVVDDRQQHLAGRTHGLELLALRARQFTVEREFGHADDAVHRRPDLVAHVRQEIALRAVRGLRLILRGAQRGRLMRQAIGQLPRIGERALLALHQEQEVHRLVVRAEVAQREAARRQLGRIDDPRRAEEQCPRTLRHELAAQLQHRVVHGLEHRDRTLRRCDVVEREPAAGRADDREVARERIADREVGDEFQQAGTELCDTRVTVDDDVERECLREQRRRESDERGVYFHRVRHRSAP